MKTGLLLLFFLCHFIALAQNQEAQDSAEVICETIFTKCEEPPYPKNGIDSFQIVLNNYLKETGQMPLNGKAKIYFVVPDAGNIFNISLAENTIGETSGRLVNALKKYSGEWVPGRQNKHVVCAYGKIEVEVKNNLLFIKL